MTPQEKSWLALAFILLMGAAGALATRWLLNKFDSKFDKSNSGSEDAAALAVEETETAAGRW
jgi:hypothetical protein